MTAVATPAAANRTGETLACGIAVAVALTVGAAAGAGGAIVILGVAAFVLFVAVAAKPALGVYLFIAVLPFIAGIERDAVLPVVRPHEALQIFLSVAVLTGWCVRYARGETARIRVTRLDWALLVMATLASVWPLVWGLARGVSLSQSDFMATAVLWRYFGLYVVCRVALRTPEEVRRCIWLVLAGAAGLGAIALLQSLGLFGIEAFLSNWYRIPDSPLSGRGTATLGNSIAVGDYLAYALAILIVWYDRRPAARRALAPIALVLVGGLVGTGQVSAWLAAGIVLVTLAWHERRVGRLLHRAVPVLGVGAAVGWPVLAKRLVDFSSGEMPVSWVVRWDNLQTFYLPSLLNWGFVLGVRPDTVIAAPETWRDEIFLESGYLALLWVGGIPLLLAFGWFLWVALQETRRVALARADDVGVVAIAAWSLLGVLGVLTIFDIHLTLRGGGDLLFILLGIAANRVVPPPATVEEEAP